MTAIRPVAILMAAVLATLVVVAVPIGERATQSVLWGSPSFCSRAARPGCCPSFGVAIVALGIVLGAAAMTTRAGKPYRDSVAM